MAQTLHEVIISVLKNEGKPLKVSRIAKIIEEGQLWFTPSKGKSPKQEQISARVNNYPHLFRREHGLVSLVEVAKEARLLRLTYNENLWELPSGHSWDKKNQTKNDIAFENKFGFGAEEWLFNQRYNVDGFQYGYIRGLWEVLSTDTIDKAYLFCIHPVSKDRLLVAVLDNLELLDPDDLPKNVVKVFKRYSADMVREIREVGADYQSVNLKEIFPIVRFRMTDTVIFDQPILINELKTGKKYNRFKPYKLEGDLESFLKQASKSKPAVFTPGKRKITQGGHTRTMEPRTVKIEGLHDEITDELEKFLAPEYTLKKKNIAIEKMVFGNNIADFVLEREDKKLVLMEIKTSGNARYNLREALGQLLDYASWEPGLEIAELVIVSPSVLTEELKGYFHRIRKSLKYSLFYWQYCRDNNKAEKFIKY